MLLEQRLRDWASRTGCTTAEHRTDVVPSYPDDTDQWREHVAADTAAREQHEAAEGDAAGRGDLAH